MTNTRQKLADSFSEGTFQLSLPCTLDWTSSVWQTSKVTYSSSIAHQYTALTHSSICLLWSQTPLIKDVFYPASCKVDHSLSGLQAQVILRLHTRLHNLEIAQILRLRGTYICVIRIPFVLNYNLTRQLLSTFVDSRVVELHATHEWPVCCDLILHW